MSKNSKNKTLKRLGKPCSDCESKETYIILINENINGVIYPEKYIHCRSCDFLELYRDKKNKGRIKEDF